MTRQPGVAVAAAGGLLLALATPPAVTAGAEFLVVPGLMLWFALATSCRRPLLHSYVLGCVHMACFSWSLHHVMVAAYVAVVVLGGLYFVLGSMLVRCMSPRWSAVAFAFAVADAFWLRANMPEIYYPHGQPCHCLWQWPALLGAVTLGGEPLGNALLAGLAATLIGVVRSWRLAVPSWSVAWQAFAAACGVAITATVVGWFVHAGATPSSPTARVRIAVVEPGVHPFDPFVGLSQEDSRQRFQALFVERLLLPTRDVLRASPPPDVVLWPESSVPVSVPVDEIEKGRARVSWVHDQFAASGARLVLGANVAYGERDTPAALMVSLPEGRVLGHQEKRCLVPGGEFLPLVGWLPASLAASVRRAFERALRTPPDCQPGTLLPPMQTTAGILFGTLLCYDNAFPGPARDQVAAGARFLCVLSNEAWYRGGAELTQLVAMTVCRALETNTPIVRCTTDGWSVVVGANGRLLTHLANEPAPHAAARILQVDLEPGSGRLPPLAWLRAATGPLAAGWLFLVLAHAACRWARLRVARTASIAAGGTGAPGPARGSGS